MFSGSRASAEAVSLFSESGYVILFSCFLVCPRADFFIAMEYLTRFPIFLGHGMGFRDGVPGYWGRIPGYLRKCGAVIGFGGQDANASIVDNAKMLRVRLDKFLAETGAEKVNVIAHSKGGLEMRRLVSGMGYADRIASLTTISTPHGGSAAMDKVMKLGVLLNIGCKITDVIKRIGGDISPDTLSCLRSFTTEYMRRFDRENPDMPGVLYQSAGFLMKGALSDVFMWFPYVGVKIISGHQSDGFLAPEEVMHGDFLGIFTGKERRGISHCDEVDMRRTRLALVQTDGEAEYPDITEFYASLVRGLAECGL